MRPKSTFYASDNLRRLYKQRIEPTDETQAEFAKRIKIGGQSMLAQILSGAKPLPIESAPKIAKALHCSIDDICPEMAEFIRDELLPSLGKALRRAAVVLLALLLPYLQPSDALASTSHNVFSSHIASLSDCLNTHWRALMELLRRAVKWPAKLGLGDSLT